MKSSFKVVGKRMLLVFYHADSKEAIGNANHKKLFSCYCCLLYIPLVSHMLCFLLFPELTAPTELIVLVKFPDNLKF